ncbi:MAG: translation initiation factor IF-2 N-terminal domain-containing protein, partial [Lachnospiraceae bacterium]|nr:translation initiation factor IF-2 N-terminal domain-containing protein [Lachnospiraceae bacterium]
MAKIRIHELAKELNVDAKDVIAFLGGDVKAVSGIEEEDASRVRNHFRPAEKPAAVKPAPAGEKSAEKQGE